LVRFGGGIKLNSGKITLQFEDFFLVQTRFQHQII